MKYFIVRPKAKPVRRNRRKSARKLLGLSMTAGLVLLVGSAGALDCGAIPAGQAFVQAAFGLTLFGGSGFALRRPKRCRRLTDANIAMLQNIQVKELHFAWDMQRHERAVLAGLRRYLESDPHKRHGAYATVYMLTNYDTEHDYDLYRVYTLRDMGYDPYVMVYDKPNAPKITRDLQRWVNNRRIFRKCRNFEEYVG